MRGFKLLLSLIVITFLLAGCGSQGNADNISSNSADYDVLNKPRAEITEGDFVYRLVTENEEYQKGDSVKLYAELEYIGDKETVTIYHAASPFYFPIVEKTRDYDISYSMNEPLLSTTLKRGEPLREEYKKSGGYDEQDKKRICRFYKKFLGEWVSCWLLCC
ncbi:hypothetical protein [Paenibacillus sp. LHD-38]|uniref:LptM family lipoprotein n=1 Tax=Paenibacillus sp. LHD-38 TaxID=3072143 RepID=UPI00280F39BA|nr:hypothetical protein [Paenibacillus sp. LHD-38]MDQ8738703.1 hypothetical protein [Paenibacillus sp. LHD-38]